MFLYNLCKLLAIMTLRIVAINNKCSSTYMFTRASLPSRVATLEGKLVGKAHVNAFVGSYLQVLELLPTRRACR